MTARHPDDPAYPGADPEELEEGVDLRTCVATRILAALVAADPAMPLGSEDAAYRAVHYADVLIRTLETDR